MPYVNFKAGAGRRDSLILLAAVMIVYAAAFFMAGRYSITGSFTGTSAPAPAPAVSERTMKKALPVDTAALAAAKAEHAIPPAAKGHDVSGKDLVYNVITVDSSEGFTGPEGDIKPTGVFLVLNVKVTNKGTAPATPLPSQVQLVDLDGYAYHASGRGLKVCEATGRTFVLCREVAPGRDLSGAIVFDVPTLKNSYRLELLDDCAAGKKLAEIYL